MLYRTPTKNMAEQHKTEEEDFQFFENYLCEKTNTKTLKKLRAALLLFGSGLARYNVTLLRVKAANANSFARFGKATIHTEPHQSDSSSVCAALSLFYILGYYTLRDFLDEGDPKIPKNLAERRALKDLLLFLANDANNRKVIVENRDNTESALALRLAQHLLIPLVQQKTFVIDSYPGLQFSKCCPDEHPVNGKEGDTSFGCPEGWHGRADILLMDDDVPLTVIETPENDETTPDDVSSVTSDSSVEVKKGENFSADSISQVIAQTIVFSFLQRKKHPLAPCSLVPGIGICSGKLVVYWYDCVEDILLTTGLVEMFAGTPEDLDDRAVIMLWLVLNHSLFGNQIPEKYKAYHASFHNVLGPDKLEMYKNQSQQPCTAKCPEEDLHWLNKERAPVDWQNDMAMLMENQFPEREVVSLKH